MEGEVPGFGEHKFQISGVKSPEELEDDIAALAVWVWSMKDYLKKLAPSVGRLPNEVDSRCLPNGFRVQAISQGSGPEQKAGPNASRPSAHGFPVLTPDDLSDRYNRDCLHNHHNNKSGHSYRRLAHCYLSIGSRSYRISDRFWQPCFPPKFIQ